MTKKTVSLLPKPAGSKTRLDPLPAEDQTTSRTTKKATLPVSNLWAHLFPRTLE
ncbi:MAG TPA: hypothetical protein PKZ53_19730 [Acidobacteriota bacterium]|nr:hypothetical protein [Acidobacteriota bacterium]